jgi:hypothetical protein
LLLLAPDASDGIVDFSREGGVKMANPVGPAKMIVGKEQ